MVLMEFGLHVYNSYKLESNIMYGFDGVQFRGVLLCMMNTETTESR